jgi:hypothetical protein
VADATHCRSEVLEGEGAARVDGGPFDGAAGEAHIIAAPDPSGGSLEDDAGALEPRRLEIPSLLPPDEHGVQVPPGFGARVVACSGERVAPGSDYVWHGAPDGGATFALSDGGWIYVSNSELVGAGGVGALVFGPAGDVRAAYPILEGTERNCAGGATPWGTWISCEEVPLGRCFQCDPLGRRPAEALPALGVFRHEAVAVDVDNHHVYLTEDQPDGRLYRFTAAGEMEPGVLDLREGLLEVLRVSDPDTGDATWAPVPDPTAMTAPTRLQVDGSQPFAGGEGIWLHRGVVFFTTKLDNRVWALELQEQRLSILYDAARYDTPTLTGVDNITMSPSGHLLVCEDEGNMELALLDAQGDPHVLLRILDQAGSELCGPAFDSTGTRLYFSSQRGQRNGQLGITYELSGPFEALAI